MAEYKPPKEKPHTESCPFCGGEPLINGFEILIRYYVKCRGCGATSDEFGTVEEAVAAWNARRTDA